MNKSELIAAVSADADITKAAAARAVDSVIENIVRAASNGGARIAGLGTFAATRRDAREGRNPRTREPVAIPAKMHPKFTPAKALRDRLSAP